MQIHYRIEVFSRTFHPEGNNTHTFVQKYLDLLRNGIVETQGYCIVAVLQIRNESEAHANKAIIVASQRKPQLAIVDCIKVVATHIAEY